MLTIDLSGVPTWIEQGPGPMFDSGNVDTYSSSNEVSGAVEAIAAHPTNANVVYVGTVNGGIWRTSNALADQDNIVWTPLSDQLSSLSIGSLVFSPLDASYNTLFAGVSRPSANNSDGGPQTGIFRTTDGGATWTPLGMSVFSLNNDGLDNDGDGEVNSPVDAAGRKIKDRLDNNGNAEPMSPTDTLTGLAKSDFIDSDGNGLIDDGIDENIDEGDEWLNIRSIVPTGIGTSLANQVVLAAAAGATGVCLGTGLATCSAPFAGIYRSADGGATWTNMSNDNNLSDSLGTGLPPGSASHLVADPGNPLRLYAGIVGQGVFRTNDGGLTWTSLNAGLTNIQAPNNGLTTVVNATRFELAVHNSVNGNTVYAALMSNSPAAQNPDGKPRLSAIFYSTNQGNTWTQMSLAGDSDGGLSPGGQGATHFSIVPHPTQPSVVFVGGDKHPLRVTGRIMRGDWNQPSGSQWETMTDEGANGSSGLDESAPHADSRDMVFLANGDILEADDGGLYRLFNPGDDDRYWESVNGDLRAIEVLSVAWDSNHNTLLIGTQDNGTAAQDNEGDIAWPQLLGGDGAIVQIAQREDALGTYSAYFFSTQNLGSFQRLRVRDGAPDTSDDIDLKVYGGGFTNAPLASIDSIPFTTIYAVNTISSNRMLLGTTNLYESYDDGDRLNWIGPLAPPTNGQINSIVYGGRRGGFDNADVAWVAQNNLLFLRKRPGNP